MLAQQQLRLLVGQSRLLSRLMRGLLWAELRPAERRRVALLLARLEHDAELAATIARPLRPESAGPCKKTARDKCGRMPPEAGSGQEALP
jgi:hypothetical protein